MERRTLTSNEPQTATEYEDRATEAVMSVLVEVGQILGSFKGKFAIVGGVVPWLAIDSQDMQHVGTVDLDIALAAEALADGEYATLIEALTDHGYGAREGGRKFQLQRTVTPKDGQGEIQVVIDFLMPRDAVIKRNVPPLLDNFAVQRADGADLAIQFPEMRKVRAEMPNGAVNTVEIPVCSIPALLAMKGFALNGRLKQKDSYDVYYCVRNYPGGVRELAKDSAAVLAEKNGMDGFRHIAAKFDTAEGYGPVSVRNFVSESRILDGRTPEQWQQDAFGQVDALLRELGLRG